MTNPNFTFGPIQEQWLQSLEQHPERQGKYHLGKKEEDGSYSACCLGELGLIAGLCEWQNNKLTVNGTTNINYLYDVFVNVGLRGEAGQGVDGEYLAVLNDEKNKTWPEIAAIVRANPENFFTKSV